MINFLSRKPVSTVQVFMQPMRWPLALGIADPKDRPTVLQNLIANIENSDYKNTTGEFGIRYLFEALAEGGRSDVAYSMMNQNENRVMLTSLKRPPRHCLKSGMPGGVILKINLC